MRADEIPKYKSSEMGGFFVWCGLGVGFLCYYHLKEVLFGKKYNILGAKIIIFALYFITLWVVKVSTIK